MVFLAGVNATAASASAAYLLHLIVAYKYYAILALMLLESASLPVPSEVVLPAIGYLAAQGQLNMALGATAAIIGSVIGFEIDYYIAYFVGKDIVYKHLKLFHIKQSTLDAFDRWFESNGSFAVFISRFIPVVRGLISFPAGFAEMPQKKFFLTSFAGTVIWDVALIIFGYYIGNATSATLIFAAIGVFAIILYLIYVYALRRIRNSAAGRGAGRKGTR